jgi:hypothetical protein
MALFLWASSLTRGRVCLLCMLLALASVVFLESESLWTRKHILLYPMPKIQAVKKVFLQFQKCITKANEKTDKWKLLQNETYIFFASF